MSASRAASQWSLRTLALILLLSMARLKKASLSSWQVSSLSGLATDPPLVPVVVPAEVPVKPGSVIAAPCLNDPLPSSETPRSESPIRIQR